MKIVAVTGPNGRLGRWLVEQHDCIPLREDITAFSAIESEIARIKPDVIINCAAFTGVDDAEDERWHDHALAVNTRGVANLRLAFGGKLIHISTGFVFPGTEGPYKEDAIREPVNWYGWTKFGGEEAAFVREPTIVIRTLDLYGPLTQKTDFVRSIRDHLELGAEKSLPDNLFKTPTYIPHLAEGIMAAVNLHVTGYLHIAGSRTMGALDWGKMIAEHFGYDPALLKPGKVEGQAPRPLRGGLNVEKAMILAVPIYSPEDGLKALSQWEADHAK